MATGAEVAQEVLDAADEVLENAAEGIETARRFTQRDLGLTVGGLGVGVTVGSIGGYFLLRKRLTTKFENIYAREVASMRDNYHRKMQALEGEEEKAKMKSELDEKVEELEYKAERDPRVDEGKVPYHLVGKKAEELEVEAPEVPEPETPETKNIFEDRNPEGDGILVGADPNWNYEEEVKNRDPKFPYVIHQDEHKEGPAGEEEYDKVTLTYFAGDDVLSDERDQVVDSKETVVGVANLSRFGHGSGDPNIVYIRNDQLQADIEVVRSDGKYATEVHGFSDDEIRHSSMRRRTPRRSDIDDMER